MAEKKKKSKGGRPGKYTEWLKPEKLILVQGWKMDGLSDADIAKNMGITETTLYDWKKRFPEFSKALKMSSDIADRIIENALFQKAKSGNLGAMIFWLKNRKPDVWRETKASEEEKELTRLQAEKLKAEIERLKQQSGTENGVQLIKIVNDVQ